MVRFSDPFGNVLELFCGATYERTPALTPYGNRFVTGEQGLGHLVVLVADDTAGLAFYRDVLGFRVRDSMRASTASWWGNRRVHRLAALPRLQPAAPQPGAGSDPGASGSVHIMLEVDRLDDVGRALERVRRRGAHLSATLGRHMNDDMVSFYVRSPAGFDVEYGWGGLQVDDDTWTTRESTAVSAWGHDFAG